MSDRSPHLLRRVLVLRQFPLLARAELAELATVAENIVERTFATGELVAPAERLESLHLVVAGRLEHGARIIEPREVLGALEVTAQRPARVPTRALVPTRTLELGASDYLEVLEDNFGLLLANLRDLAARVAPLGLPRPIAIPTRSEKLGLVERMILLRQLLPFGSSRLEALAILAHAAVEVRWPAGTIVHRAGAPADRAAIIVEGSLRAGDRLLEPGHSIGILETLSGIHYATTVEATTPVRALVSSADTILDVLEDHVDFALGILQTFARILIDSDGADLARDPTASSLWRWNASC